MGTWTRVYRDHLRRNSRPRLRPYPGILESTTHPQLARSLCFCCNTDMVLVVRGQQDGGRCALGACIVAIDVFRGYSTSSYRASSRDSEPGSQHCTLFRPCLVCRSFLTSRALWTSKSLRRDPERGREWFRSGPIAFAYIAQLVYARTPEPDAGLSESPAITRSRIPAFPNASNISSTFTTTAI